MDGGNAAEPANTPPPPPPATAEAAAMTINEQTHAASSNGHKNDHNNHAKHNSSNSEEQQPRKGRRRQTNRMNSRKKRKRKRNGTSSETSSSLSSSLSLASSSSSSSSSGRSDTRSKHSKSSRRKKRKRYASSSSSSSSKKHRRKRRRKAHSNEATDSSSSSSSSSSDTEEESSRHRRRKRQKESKRKKRKKIKKKKRKTKIKGAGGDTYEKKQLRDAKKAKLREVAQLARKLETGQGKEQEEESVFGYSNEANPFHDANLTRAFVWTKKYEKQISEGKEPDLPTAQSMREKQKRLKQEIDAVKARREEREIERMQMEEMREQMRRDADYDQNRGWEDREKAFHKEQAKLRTQLRVAAGRAKAIDILARNLYFLDDVTRSQEENDAAKRDLIASAGTANSSGPAGLEFDMEMDEPYLIFDRATADELRELRDDIHAHLEMKWHESYWHALLILCEAELKKVESSVAGGGAGADSNSSLKPALLQDVHRMFDGKSSEELDMIEKEVLGNRETALKHVTTSNSSNAVGSVTEDASYWDSLLPELHNAQARTYLREAHRAMLSRYLEYLEALDAKEQKWKEEEDVGSAPRVVKGDLDTTMGEKEQQQVSTKDKEDINAVAGHVAAAVAPADDDHTGAVGMDDDLGLDEEAAFYAAAHGKAEEVTVLQDRDAAAAAATESSADARAFERARAAPLGQDEECMGADAIATGGAASYAWDQKYRPRKPLFFNRVKTGFHWSKYNRTHYDKDNPPPKVVLGYKFNVFYPDLIDPSKPPGYRVEPLPGQPDFCVIRFIGGAPYEDIAFKIVSKDWETSRRRGFRSSFNRGVLQLHFNFKRVFYRR